MRKDSIFKIELSKQLKEKMSSLQNEQPRSLVIKTRRGIRKVLPQMKQMSQMTSIEMESAFICFICNICGDQHPAVSSLKRDEEFCGLNTFTQYPISQFPLNIGFRFSKKAVTPSL